MRDDLRSPSGALPHESLDHPDEFDQRQGRQYRGGGGADRARGARRSARTGCCCRSISTGPAASRRTSSMNAERFPGGPAYTMAQRQAVKHRIFVHAGSIMEKIDGEDRIHNTSVVFNREGEEIARYRKIHLFDVTTPDGPSYKESATVKAGRRRSSPTTAKASPSAARSATTCAFPTSSRRWRKRGPRSSRSPPPSPCRPARTTGKCCCAPGRSRPRLMSAPAPRPAPSPSATSSARPTAIRSSPTPGAMWSPRPRTASASCRRWPPRCGLSVPAWMRRGYGAARTVRAWRRSPRRD